MQQKKNTSKPIIWSKKYVQLARNQTGRSKTILLIFLSIVGIMGLVFFVAWYKFPSTLVTLPFEPPVMTAARYSPRDAVGDLGGMPVTIPSYFANFVEYEGDPGWHKREGPVPERNHQSKLVSFGFKVRFPDMAGLSSRELEKNHRSFTIDDTPWIDVGITTGVNFGDGLGLERSFSGLIEENKFKVEHQAAKQFDLDVYSPVGVDPSTRQPFKHSSYDEDVFVYRNAEGKVLTLITCSNVNHAAAPCDLRFLLDPALKAWIEIHFRRGLLPEWQQIQSSVATLILNFKRADAAIAPLSATPPDTTASK